MPATVFTVPITVNVGDASKRCTSSRLAEERSPSAMTIGTSRTSVVAAYPSIASWMIGATTTIPIRRGFMRISRNSFRMSARSRCRRGLRMSGPLLRQPQGRQTEDDGGVDAQGAELGKEVRKRGPLQDDAAK